MLTQEEQGTIDTFSYAHDSYDYDYDIAKNVNNNDYASNLTGTGETSAFQGIP